MPIRLRITFLFTALVFVILGMVCTSVYYFSYNSFAASVRQRLANRAITTARLLTQSEMFDPALVGRIDSLTTISLKRKAVKAYDYQNHPIYNYADMPGDTLVISKEILDEARVSGSVYFSAGNKGAVAYHYTDNNIGVVMIAAGEDEEGRRNLGQLLTILLLSFMGGLVIAFTGGYFFSSKLLLPVKKIADDVNEITAQSFTRRIATSQSTDEWHYLSSTINKLLDRLQESFEVQRRFISNASHELSTPLTSISSQLEVYLQRDRPADEYRKVMESVYQDVRQMSTLTQTLLEFAKASGSSGGIEIAPIRIDEVLLRLPAEAMKVNTRFQVKLEFKDLPEEESDLLIVGNEELLFTAIKNVVINACKYSPDNQAKVVLSVNSEKIEIEIHDKGSGIPAAEQDKIFQPFYRIDESRTTEGFGLGLALADRIVKLHSGRLALSATGDAGTVFAMHFPGRGDATSKQV